MDENKFEPRHDSHRDPITGEPGAHPVGVGVGTAIGGALGGGVAAAAAAGAAAGTVVGPVGTAVGTAVGVAVGGVLGAIAGREVAEHAHPTEEGVAAPEINPAPPFADRGAGYGDLGPAYHYGREARSRLEGRRFEDVETELERDWQRQNPDLAWDRAAVRNGWDHIDQPNAGAPVPPVVYPPVP